ncbi:MAG TPA: hypothetical protein VFD48_11285 [Pyrinomonadaceae bacterium]|nr:hypothetical protein [Pyrinomonadaceae bacterium]
MTKRVFRYFAAVVLIAFLTACADNAIQPDDVLGEWEKQEDSLPTAELGLVAR